MSSEQHGVNRWRGRSGCQAAHYGIIVAVVVAMLATASGARAADRFWNVASGGDFNANSNWAPGIVPSILDRAIFDLSSGGYMVDFTSNPSNDRMLVADDNVTFHLNS